MTVHRGPRGLHRLMTALGEPTRRRAYDVVRRSDWPVSRSDVAAELGIGLRLAAFHLDKLVDEGLVSAHYARPAERRGGPGAGRPAKRYVASPARFDVTLPPRRYDVAARILLRSLGDPTDQHFLDGARRYGASVAREHADMSLADVLVELGYEPRPAAEGAVDLTNCPFHELAEEDRATTCAMNHAFLQGVTAAVDHRRDALLEPRPGYCCVRLSPSPHPPA